MDNESKQRLLLSVRSMAMNALGTIDREGNLQSICMLTKKVLEDADVPIALSIGRLNEFVEKGVPAILIKNELGILIKRIDRILNVGKADWSKN